MGVAVLRAPGGRNPLKSSVTGPSLLDNCNLEIKFREFLFSLHVIIVYFIGQCPKWIIACSAVGIHNNIVSGVTILDKMASIIV